MKVRPFFRYLRRQTSNTIHSWQEWQQMQRNRPHIKRLTPDELSPAPDPRASGPLPVPSWLYEALEDGRAETVKRQTVRPAAERQGVRPVDIADMPTIRMERVSLPPITERTPALSSPPAEQGNAPLPRRGAKMPTNPLPEQHQQTGPLHPIHLEHVPEDSNGHHRSPHVTQPLALIDIVDSRAHHQLLNRIREEIERFRETHGGEPPDRIYLSRFNYLMMCLMHQEHYYYREKAIALADDSTLSWRLDDEDIMCRHWIL